MFVISTEPYLSQIGSCAFMRWPEMKYNIPEFRRTYCLANALTPSVIASI